jgi:hypothetical protein
VRRAEDSSSWRRDRLPKATFFQPGGREPVSTARALESQVNLGWKLRGEVREGAPGMMASMPVQMWVEGRDDEWRGPGLADDGGAFRFALGLQPPH